MRWLLAACLLTASVACTAEGTGEDTAEPVAVAASPSLPVPEGWRPVWGDEFDGSFLDRGKWTAERNSTFGDGNGELACLTDRPENLTVAGGVLLLTARREASPYRCGQYDRRFPRGRPYTSALISTQGMHSWTYGRFEIRAKLPTTPGASKGLWPAFWMRPDDGGKGEIDVFEALGSGVDQRLGWRIFHTIAYDYVPTHARQTLSYDLPGGAPSTAEEFHTYAVEWEPGRIRWLVDGRETFVRDQKTTPWLDEAFSRPFFLRVNLAVGGSWPGSPDAATVLPASYVVDYVRVYAR